MILIFLRRDLRIDLAAQSQNGFFRNAGGSEKRFAGHAIIALGVVGRNTTFIAKRDQNFLPRKVARHSRKLGINGPRCVPAGKRDAELVALTDRLVRKIDNEIRGVGHEIFRPKNFAAHEGKVRAALAPRVRTGRALSGH